MQKVVKAKGLVDVVKEKIIQDPVVIIEGDKIISSLSKLSLIMKAGKVYLPAGV